MRGTLQRFSSFITLNQKFEAPQSNRTASNYEPPTITYVVRQGVTRLYQQNFVIVVKKFLSNKFVHRKHPTCPYRTIKHKRWVRIIRIGEWRCFHNVLWKLFKSIRNLGLFYILHLAFYGNLLIFVSRPFLMKNQL